jgi:hypothetical protein
LKGAIAQLGERLHGMQEVRGSIPLGSTKKNMKQARFEKVELNQILQLYGMMVSQGLWRDYSISFLKEFAVFSVYRKNSDWALFSIKKTPKNSKYGRLYSLVGMDGEILKFSNDLKSTLRVLKHKELKINLL